MAAVDIDYPVPGCVPATFMVGGTYDATVSNQDGPFQVEVNLYNSDDEQVGATAYSPSYPNETGLWEASYTDPDPPTTGGYLVAQLLAGDGSDVGEPDQVDGISTSAPNNGGTMTITP
jgi:hypothetical protein